MKQIYFLRQVGERGPVKIGCSINPPNRLECFNALSPVPLEILAVTPGSHEIERRLHKMFASSRSHGEWFNATDQLEALIRAVATGAPISGLVDMTLPIKRRAVIDWTARVKNWRPGQPIPATKPRKRAA